MNKNTLTTLLLAATVTLAASVWAGCCDPETDVTTDAGVGPDASHDASTDADAETDATEPSSLRYRMGCFPRYGEQQLARTAASPRGDFVCCEYRSLETDPPQEPQLYCGTRDDIGQDSPFFAVETP